MDIIEIFQLIAPELSSDLNLVEDAVTLAELQVGADLCGDKRPLLVAYLAAHLLSLTNRKTGSSGSLTSLSEGNLSLGFGQSGLMGSLGQTVYGVEYDRLSRGCIFAVRTRVMSE